MFDQIAWSKFKADEAEFVIGSPTLELIFASYNQTHPEIEHMSRVINSYGYDITKDYGASWDNEWAGQGMFNTSFNKLYLTDISYWLASPFADATSLPSVEKQRNGIEWKDCLSGDGHYSGFRPVVCLKSDTKLQQLENGNFAIIK